MKTTFNKKEFISSINNYETFGEYDDVLRYDAEDGKSSTDNVSDHINDFLSAICYGVDLEKISHADLLEHLQADYDQETARNEYTDWLIDIYYNDIYNSCATFSWYVEQAQAEYGNNSESLDKQIQQGQYYAYDMINNLIYSELVDYLESN